MESLIGVVIGGLISIVTTITMDQRHARRELRHRWDADGLEAIASYIEAVNRAIARCTTRAAAGSLTGKVPSGWSSSTVLLEPQ